MIENRRLPLGAYTALVFAIVSISVLVARSAMLAQNPRLLGYAVFADLTLSLGVAHLLLGIRVAGLPAWTLAPTVGLGAALALQILPQDARPPASLVPLLFLALEGGVVLSLVLGARRVWRLVGPAQTRGASFFDALQEAISKGIPAIAWAAPWLRFEAEMMSFAFGGWFRRPSAPKNAMVFRHHITSNWGAVALAVFTLSIFEGFVLHMLLWSQQWYLPAYIALGLHAYSLVWLVGDMQAMRLQSSCIHLIDGVAKRLSLRVGIRARADIDIDNIDSVVVREQMLEESAEIGVAKVYGRANVLLTLKQPVEFSSFLRTPRQVTAIAIQFDEPERFVRQVLAVASRLSG